MSTSSYSSRVENIAELLAVLVAENESYTYVDKLGYAPSKDLVLYYLREALRDFHSLKKKPEWGNRHAKEEADKINIDAVKEGIQDIERISGMKDLRERVSLIAAKALAIASALMKKKEEEKPKAAEETSSSGS